MTGEKERTDVAMLARKQGSNKRSTERLFHALANWPIVHAGVVFSACLLILMTPSEGRGQEAAGRHVALIEFESEIHSLSEQYLYRKLEEARERGAEVVVIEVDSPGGDAEASIRMGKHLRDIHWAKTIAYVPDTALSGAAIFSLGCDEIIMTPDAVFGDAGPIFLDEDFLFKHASEKYRSHLARAVRDLASAKNRPPALAEAMVDMGLIVYQVTNRVTGQETFMSQAEIDSSDAPEEWEKIKPVLESREDHFLEVNGRRAVELKLANRVVADRDELKQVLEPVARWDVVEHNAFDTLILVLNTPVATGLLFIVGLVALYIEFAAPGLGLGGVTALVCFAVFFWSRFLGGTAEWLDVVLFGSGILLLLVEFFVIPGFGIWGITGILLMMSSLVLASQSFVIPQTRDDLQSLTGSLLLIVGCFVAFLIIASIITRNLGHVPVLGRLLLEPPGSEDPVVAQSDGPPTETKVEGRWIRVGQRGRAETPLRPAGRVRIDDTYLDVVSDGSFIEPGSVVQVIDVRGNRIVVRQV